METSNTVRQRENAPGRILAARRRTRRAIAFGLLALAGTLVHPRDVSSPRPVSGCSDFACER